MNSINILMNPGISFYVNDKIIIEASIGGIYYSRLKSKVTDPDIITYRTKVIDEDFGFSFALSSLILGLKYNL